MIDRQELVRRANQYCARAGVELGQQLGFGVHGTVFTLDNQGSSGPTAIKIHEQERFYRRERDIYLRLREEGVSSILNCHVPRLLRFDDQLFVLEMSVVKPPYVLDFAGAYLDREPDFSDEVMADWEEEKREQFGSDWPKVQAIVRSLENFGIYMADINPGNIRFR